MSEAEQEKYGIGRVVDLRLPLTWLLGGLIMFGWAFISLYFNVNALLASTAALQITVNTGNASSAVLASEVALMKFRQSNAEADIARLKDGPPMRKEKEPK